MLVIQLFMNILVETKKCSDNRDQANPLWAHLFIRPFYVTSQSTEERLFRVDAQSQVEDRP